MNDYIYSHNFCILGVLYVSTVVPQTQVQVPPGSRTTVSVALAILWLSAQCVMNPTQMVSSSYSVLTVSVGCMPQMTWYTQKRRQRGKAFLLVFELHVNFLMFRLSYFWIFFMNSCESYLKPWSLMLLPLASWISRSIVSRYNLKYDMLKSN